MGHLEQLIRLHAFGPLLAAGLLVWSLSSWRAGTMWPWSSQARWPLPASVGVAAALLLYWLARLALQYGLGLPAFLTRATRAPASS